MEKINQSEEKSFSQSLSRRKFLTISSAAVCGMAVKNTSGNPLYDSMSITTASSSNVDSQGKNLIGAYGEWAAKKNDKIPSQSFRNDKYQDFASWKKNANKLVLERMAPPDLGAIPEVKVNKQYYFDGLYIEELSWKLPYGKPAEAILLKPENSKGKLPGILALHHHGGDKYFGKRKIVQTAKTKHEHVKNTQQRYYEGIAWANEIAKRGYVVLVNDAFPFASRRVMFQDVPENLSKGMDDSNPENLDNINKYNKWASDHENIMAKSLFCAGTTWPGVFYAEDRIALDILCNRNDVDENNIGCGGLSGGGMRTVFLGGLDSRIKCAVCVGFMTTWEDFMLNKSITHTWMTYVPLLPNELDFPEILGLRAPLPTLVQNNNEDPLYTLPEMQEADKILSEVFDKTGAGDKYKCSYYPGPHKFDKEMQKEAFDWLDKWLK